MVLLHTLIPMLLCPSGAPDFPRRDSGVGSVRHHVTLEVPLLGASVGTHAAPVRLLPRVSVHVLLHPLLLRCTVGAVGAAVRFLPGVGQHVALKVFLGGGSVAAAGAGERLLPRVGVSVAQQVGVVSGGVGAVGTVVCLDAGSGRASEPLPSPRCCPPRTRPHTASVQPHLLVTSCLLRVICLGYIII